MDGQRQQYIPAPPPPSISQPPQSHIISLPPPPPRHPPAQSHGVVPPPPPGPPPGAGYGVPSGWQQNWGRQGLPQGFPPPPPPPPPILPSNQPQNQHLAYGRQPAPLSILPPPPQSENQPLTSATYIPAGESFGPGVGIPPLFDSHPRSGYDAYGQSTGADRHQSYETVSSDGSYMRDGSIPPTPSNRNVPSSLVLHENVHELVSPGLPTATIQNPQPQSSGQGPELSKTPSHRHNSSNASLGGMSPSEAAIQWPLERVLLWLAENGFSSDWQETFKTLEIQGADFIELGHGGANGRGNLGKMHKVVYPQLAKECAKSGTGWDQGREREEGKRMRKLIRQIHDDGSTDAGIVVQKRRGSHPAVLSASSEGGLEHSPNLGWESLSAAPRNNMENSPSQNYTLKTSHSCFNQRQSMQLRSVTLPIPTTSHDSTAAELSGSARSDYSRNILSGLEHRRQSPSISSEGGPFAAPSLRPYEDSPQSGSPATQPASLSHPGLTSSSTGDLSVKSDHSRGNSTDSAMGSGRGHLATSRSGTGGVPGEAPSRFYEARRQGQEIARPSGQDSYTRQLSGEHSSYPKEHSKSFLNIFKKKSKNTDSTHASPEEQNLESPTSPVNTRNGSHLPFAKPGYNTSEVSLGERPSSASMSDHEKMSIWRRSINSTKGKKYAFATLDGWNYRLIDMTDVDSADSLRAAICQNLGVIDWTSAQIFLTEPGQIDHEEPLNDNMLVHSRRTKSDSIGTLKFYVRGTYAHPGTNISPHYAGLGVSISEKSTASPITGQHHLLRKPVDDDSGISPHSQPRPASPSPVSRQPVLKATTTDSAHELSPALPGASPVDGFWEAKQGLSPEKADLLARHEAHKREVERKQKQYNISKQPPPSQRKDNYSDLGYRREGVIDFDERRPSPFNDDKKPDSNLVPHRKPPSAPAGSTTLTKVNSLRRARPQQTTQTDLKQRPEVSVTEEMTERDNRKPVTPTSALGHGLGAAIASVGRMTSAIGTPSPSHAIQSGDFSLNGASRPSPVTSPAAEKPSQPVTESRKSYGPEFDFQETRVSFQQSPRPQEDSDEDSDDGLFAIPIAPNKNQSKGKQATPGSPETPKKSERPSLTLDTEPRLGKGLSVRFKSPNTSGDTSTGPSTHSSTSDTEQVPESRNTSNISSDDERSSRRDSFARDDIWASRPPVEGVIDHLDEFFPDIDLDEPYLEGNGISPPSSPTAVPNRDAVEHNANLKDKQADPAWAAQLNNENGDTLGSDGSAMKAKETNGITRRNATRAGGLGRMKSIREVAKGAHQVNRNRSVAHSTNANAAPLLRRKSTKMFGAKIMQISPRPGSRLSELDPIPQNAVPQDSIPQRQPTFRIIRGQLIGKGTYGRVYLGINADNGELLAVKQVEVNPKIAGQDKDRIKEMVAAMDQEIDTMQHLEHPNIVQYLGCERGEFSISIYLEYISGGSVGSCLRKHGKFEERVVKSLTRQTLSGLAYLHDQGILHRDLKADNILLDLDGTCKISDFGISKKSDNIYGNDSSNSMQGSVFWMAPEVIQSQGQGYSAKVDIWSLGCVVLEMFAGRRPWSKEEAIGAIFKLGSLNQAPPIPEDVSMNISPAALAFMYDCFTVDTFDRPTAETLLSRHPFCEPDPDYDFLKTELYAKIRHVL